MRLLILDLVRQRARPAAFFSALLLGMLLAAHAAGEPARGFGFSMGTAFGLGPLLAMRFGLSRAIWYLPVRRRDLWRAYWLVATVAATLLTTFLKLIALAIFPAMEGYGLPGVALSSLMDFAYAGAGCGLAILSTRPAPPPGLRRHAHAVTASLADLAFPFGFPVAAFLPQYVDILPAGWGDLTPVGWTVLLAGLVVAVATGFYTPAAPERVPASVLFTAATSAPPRRRRATPRPSRLSGLPRLLAHEGLWTLGIGLVICAATALAVSVASALMYGVSAWELLPTTGALLDGAGTPGQQYAARAAIALVCVLLVGVTLAARFPAMLRHLRVLPVGTRRMTLLLTAWPILVWIVVAASMMAARWFTAGAIPAPSPALLLGLVGLSALAQALTLRLSGIARMMAFGAAIGLVPLLAFASVPADIALSLLGLAGLAAAALLNGAALRRSATYRPAGP